MTNHTTNAQDAPIKRCPKCGETKPATAEYFHRDRHEADGITVCCKACRNGPPLYDVPLPPGKKVCAKCGKVKPETSEYFPLDKTGHNGLSYRCKVCRGLAQKKQETTEYQRVYRAKNKEHLIEQQHIYHAKTENKNRRRERDKQNRPKIRDAAREYAKRWRIENPEAWRIRKRHEMHRRKALKLKAPGSHTPQDIDNQYEKQKGKCAYCQCEVGKNYHVDHVLALSRGGSNGPENLVIACPFCNMSKCEKLLYIEWTPKNPLPGIV